MSITDQVAEVVNKLNSHADAWMVGQQEDRNTLINERVMAFDGLVAARLIATLAAEVEAGRRVDAPTEEQCFTTLCVNHDRWQNAKAATDALLAEVGKEKTNGQV